MGFCSFAIGLYWRYKFRSRYLALELEETRLLNEQLSKSQETDDIATSPEVITLTGTTNLNTAATIPNNLWGNFIDNPFGN